MFTLANKVAVVTGGGSGIGRAICQRFAQQAKTVVSVDLNGDSSKETAALCGNGAIGMQADVSSEDGVRRVLDACEAAVGGIDVFVANAGIGIPGGTEVPNAEYERIFQLNVMSTVYTARHWVPRLKSQPDGGYLVVTGSAAGLLSQVGSLPYTMTKHAVVGVAEWLAITHGDDGLRVSCLCPQAVDTPMVQKDPLAAAAAGIDGILSPEAVAEEVLQAMERGDFLILPHESVYKYVQHKAADRNRWIRGMRKVNAHVRALDGGTPDN